MASQIPVGRSNHESLVACVHNESLVAQLVRAPNRYLGGHGFDSRQGLRIFLCPMLVSLLKKIIFEIYRVGNNRVNLPCYKTKLYRVSQM